MIAPPQEILNKAAQIRLLICDVDGVLTDGRIYFTPDGDEFKGFHARDGHGLKLLQRTGVEIAVISGRRSPAVALRMESLGIQHVFQGYEKKLEPFQQLLESLCLKPVQASFVGDDLLDLCLMRRAGLAVAVADAHFTLRQDADWITSQPGGYGAVREVCDLIMTAQNTLQDTIESYY